MYLLHFLRPLFSYIHKICTIFYKKSTKKLDILYKSSNFIVINKDPDIVINSNDPSVSDSLHILLTDTFPLLINPKLRHNFHFVHRLDYATSGVICVALNKKAATAAALSFEKRLAKKYYIALLRGHVAGEILDITASIGEVKSEVKGNHAMCVGREEDCVGVRSAHTRLLVLERGTYARYPTTKVLLRPFTGRRHQLRVHTSHAGHTIVGDYTYSRKKDTQPHRTFLHALRLVLPNPVEPLDIRTADPFPSSNALDGWESFEVVNDLDLAFNKIDLDLLQQS